MFAPNLQSLRLLQSVAHRLSGFNDDFDPLMDLSGDAVFVSTAKRLVEPMSFVPTRTV